MQSVIGGLIGLLVNPRGGWRVTERWKTMGGAEPAGAYLTVLRMVGAAALTIGLLVCFGVVK